MGIFGKKKEEEITEDDDELTPDEERQDRRLTRKFKDLNPENKKKRKEPPKPWGKKERMIVLSILLATVLISAMLTLSSTEFKLPGVSSFSGIFNMPDFKSFNIFKEETIEIYKK